LAVSQNLRSPNYHQNTRSMGFCIISFLKVGKKENIENLLYKGEVYFQSTNWFREQEKENNEQGDDYETACWVHSFDDCMIPNEIGEWQIINNEPFVVRRYNSVKNQGNAFCMYAFHKKGEGKIHYPSINIKKFGDTMLCIYNPKVFIDRIEAAIRKEGYSCVSGPVMYYDESKFNGCISPFQKRIKYESQQEARIFIPNTLNIPIKFKIGSIEDIAFIVTDDIFGIYIVDNEVRIIKKTRANK
jgi:hypothetical protein